MVERVVQVLQGRSDDPRSTSGAGSDLELSCFEILGDGRGDGGLRSFPGIDVVGGGCSEPERVCSSRSCEGDEGKNIRRRVERWMYAQLEKSSISLFKTMPSEVMIFEPQYKLIAMRMVNVHVQRSTTRPFDERLTRGERNNVTPLVSSCQMGSATIVQDDIVGRVVLCGPRSIPENKC